MPDTAPSTELPTCPRHPKRAADPVLCRECVDEARTATWRLPEQHRLLLGVRHATRTRLERRSIGAEPPSISPWFDHADDIASSLRTWAGYWAAALELTDGEGHNLDLSRSTPSTCASLLLDTRHGDPFANPTGAEEVARDVIRLHRQAAVLLGDVEEKPRPAKRRAPGPCPGCGMCTLYRTDGSRYIRCNNCPGTLSLDEYRAYAHQLAAAHRGAA